MKVKTHLKAGLTPGDVANQAGQVFAAAQQTVMTAAQGVSNLAHDPTIRQAAITLWYWPFGAPRS